jgi:superfamily I DNA/RNA helicase
VQQLVRHLVPREEVEPSRIAILTGIRFPAALGIAEGFAQWDALESTARSRPEGVLATRIDKAKGLEWPVVILWDVELVSPEQLFVGITRAQTMVWIVV